ncbi:DnaJ domain protein, partial [Opisthorchis viverrini]
MKNKETQVDDLLKQESYKVLEVQANVTVGELKKAYYRLAKRFHPDKNPDSVSAAHHFVRINTAYQTLRSGLRAGDVTDWMSSKKNDQFEDSQGG